MDHELKSSATGFFMAVLPGAGACRIIAVAYAERKTTSNFRKSIRYDVLAEGDSQWVLCAAQKQHNNCLRYSSLLSLCSPARRSLAAAHCRFMIGSIDLYIT